MIRLNFDIETDGLDEAATVVHSLVIRNVDTGEVFSCADQPNYIAIDRGVKMLEEADVVCGHNIIRFDIPVLTRLRGLKLKGLVRDSLVLSQLMYHDLKTKDKARWKRGQFPSYLIGRHSLEAWGYRVGNYKGDFFRDEKWDRWSPKMQSYCEQDVNLQTDLQLRMEKKNYPEAAIQLEHDFAELMFRQQKYGFKFNVEAAHKLEGELRQLREDLTREIQSIFPPTVTEMKTPEYYEAISGATFATIKAGIAAGWKRRDLIAGPNRKKVEQFNPGSRKQIAERLMVLGWKPKEFTDTGEPKVTDESLAEFGGKEADLIRRYLLVDKRLGQLADGDSAWLKLEKNGRIHGEVLGNGTRTGRATHIKPNITQVPSPIPDKEGHPLLGEAGEWGFECRSLFTADDGMVLVGADASGLEARALAHFMAKFDGGAYGEVLLNGDVHSVNQKAAGLPARCLAKRWFYGYLYGAGDLLLGSVRECGYTVLPNDDEIKLYKETEVRRWERAARMLAKQKHATDDLSIAATVKGSVLRDRFEQQTPALAELKASLVAAYHRNGHLKGIDGRILMIPSQHTLLNTLLQSAGALAVKYATVLLDRKLRDRGYVFGRDYANVSHSHDELQLTVSNGRETEVGPLAVQCIRDAGEHFKFRIKLDGEFKVGRTWAETH